MAKRFSKARAWAGRRYANRGAYYARAKGMYAKSGLNVSPEFLAGAAAAFIAPEHEMLTVGSLLVGTAPVKGLGKFKGVAQGYVFGQVMQKWVLPKLGINFGNVMGAGSSISNIV